MSKFAAEDDSSRLPHLAGSLDRLFLRSEFADTGRPAVQLTLDSYAGRQSRSEGQQIDIHQDTTTVRVLQHSLLPA